MHFTYHHTSSGKGSASIRGGVTKLHDILERPIGKYATHEEFACLPFDPSIRAEVEQLAQRFFNTRLKYVIIIGIGGSNLGAEAVYRAIFGSWVDLTRNAPKLISLDTIDPEYIEQIIEIIGDQITHHEEVVINVISKSGSTTETTLNTALLLHALRPIVNDIDRSIVATTEVGSKLALLAQKNGWSTLPIPKMIGGRYSVLSPVGLFPLRLLGVDIDMLLRGAREVIQQSTALTADNDALRTAELLSVAMEQGISQWNLFFFAPQFEMLGKWSRQLIAESLGKEKDKNGKIVHKGITPVVSIGTTDLHSMAQLYFGGPRDKFTTIISRSHLRNLVIKNNDPMLSLIDYRKKSDLSYAQAIRAIIEGVHFAYDKHQLPYQHLTFPEDTTYGVGGFIAWLECVVYLLSLSLHVDPFDQPNVEDYKLATKRILG